MDCGRYSILSELLICQQPIENQWEAILLPYIDPVKYPDVVEFAGAFVHRKCFESWPLREKMSEAAFSLMRDGLTISEPQNLLQVGDKMLVVKAFDAILFKDFQLMLELEISKEEGRDTAKQWFDFFLERKMGTELKGSRYQFTIKSKGLQVLSFVNGEMIINTVIPNDRLDVWERALDSLLQPV